MDIIFLYFRVWCLNIYVWPAFVYFHLKYLFDLHLCIFMLSIYVAWILRWLSKQREGWQQERTLDLGPWAIYCICLFFSSLVYNHSIILQGHWGFIQYNFCPFTFIFILFRGNSAFIYHALQFPLKVVGHQHLQVITY